ncbi:Protein RGF1 INDUCIBLE TRANSCRIPTION FACTOR 1 [Linum grandiflorum]
MVGRELYMENNSAGRMMTMAMKEEEQDESIRNGRWIDTLLSIESFVPCENHMELRKNEKNVFCLDCRTLLCRHCLKSKSSNSCKRRHRLLQIFKYVYNEVARLIDVQNYLDCSLIQTYKINGEMAVHLHQRQIQKDAKPSTKAKFGAACVVCGKYLQDLPNRFCSIVCKISWLRLCIPGDETRPFSMEEAPKTPCNVTGNRKRKQRETDEESASALTETTSGDMEQQGGEEEEEQRETEMLMGPSQSPFLPGSYRRKSHQRKGVPCRSPLF